MAAINSSSATQPLFIVDRDWLRQGSKARKSWTGNVRNRSLYGLAIQVTQYDVPGVAARSKSKARGRKKRRDKQGDATDSESQGEPERCLQRAASSVAIRQTYHSPNPTGPGQPEQMGAYSWPENPALHPPISLGLPGLKHIRGLECYLDYYLDVIGTAQHPIENQFRLRSNPAPSSWFTSAFEDDVWLQNIALSSALHHASNQGASFSHGANALMSSFLAQLKDRVSRADLSDSTIASVACLTLSEHIKGNAQLAKVHATGMAEMVRLRGGLHTIERMQRNRIFRADLVRSVDTLEPPLLAQLPRESLPALMNPQERPSELAATIAKLSHNGVSSTLITIFWTLGTICELLEGDWMGQSVSDTTSYYEHLMRLNHDLLTFSPRSAFDEALKLSIINFVQPMFRYCPYTQNSCELRAQRLRAALGHIYLERHDQNMVLWILFTGYMSSEQTIEHDWFKTQLTQVLHRRQISTSEAWQNLGAQLRTIVWTDSIHDQLGQHFFSNLQDNKRRAPAQLNKMCSTCTGDEHNNRRDSCASRSRSV